MKRNGKNMLNQFRLPIFLTGLLEPAKEAIMSTEFRRFSAGNKVEANVEVYTGLGKLLPTRTASHALDSKEQVYTTISSASQIALSYTVHSGAQSNLGPLYSKHSKMCSSLVYTGHDSLCKEF